MLTRQLELWLRIAEVGPVQQTGDAILLYSYYLIVQSSASVYVLRYQNDYMEACSFPLQKGYGSLPCCKAKVQVPKFWWVFELSSTVTPALKV